MNARLPYKILGLLMVAVLMSSCGGQSTWQDGQRTHIVRKGETLFAIAWRYNKNASDLARWNRLGNGSLIYPGQELKLYGAAAVRRSTTSSRPQGSHQQKPPTRPSNPLPTIPDQPAPKWSWPTSGQVNVNFGAKPGTGTGVLINGKAGQAIRAAASGRVVYAGDGLIGYGKLIIVKHNDTYLSAYGYNASLLVKEGERVNKGQRIATMGEGPERKPRLHFEIRRNGQPANPRQYLPAR